MLHYLIGRTREIRTPDQRIKSPLLYQLSYGPIIWYRRKESNLHFLVRSEGYTPLYDSGKLVPGARFELATNGLSSRCSTTELSGYCSVNELYANTFGIVSITGPIPSNCHATFPCTEPIECPCVRFIATIYWISIVIGNFFSFD